MDTLHSLAVGLALGGGIAFSDLTVRAIWRWWNN